MWLWTLNITNYIGLGFSRSSFQMAIYRECEGQSTRSEGDVSPIRCWTYILCNLGLAMWACPWATAHTKCIGRVMSWWKTCRPINGLSILWSMGWGCCRSLITFFVKLIAACRLYAIYVRKDHDSNVWVMVARLVWITWTSLFAIWERPLTHWGLDKMAAFSQTTLSNAFSWMKIL